MAAEDDVKELESELRPFLPWTVEWASDLRRQLDALPPAPLAISRSEYATTGPRSWDRGVEGMLKLLRRADEYYIKWNEDPDGGRFRSLWYRFGELGPDGQENDSLRGGVRIWRRSVGKREARGMRTHSLPGERTSLRRLGVT